MDAEKEARPALAVSTLEEIKSQFAPIVELPGWDPEVPFRARVGQISMMNLIRLGKIPNELLAEAEEIVASGKNPLAAENRTPDRVQKFSDLLLTVARACLMEPTFDQLEEAGIALTDDQLMWIYAVSQRGIRVMRSFRRVQGGDSAPRGDGESVEQGPQ